MFEVGTAVGYLTLDTSSFTQGFRDAEQQMDKFEQKQATLSDKLGAVGSALTGVGTVMAGSMTAIGTGALMLSTNFDAAMSNVQAVSGATADEMELLEEEARRMGSITKFSATESAEAFGYMAMAGWDVESMLAGLEGIMYLAGASGTDLATTSDIVTDALTAFGYTADDTTMFVDVLAAASAAANTNVEMLGESFKYVAPVAGALEYSVQDTAIALGLMANAGIKASQGGTALRTILTNMVNPTDAMAEAMNVLGVSLTDDEGNMLSLLEVMDSLRAGFKGSADSSDPFIVKTQELSAALKEGTITQEEYEAAVAALTEDNDLLTESQVAQYAAMLAGKEGMSGLLAIVNASEEDYQRLTDSIYDANGAATNMYEIMQDNLAGSLAELKSGVEEAGISIGEVLTPMISDLAEKVKGAVSWFNDLSDEDKELIVNIGLMVAAIGGLLMVFGTLASSLGAIIGLVETLGGMGAIVTALTGPLGIVIAAVAALALAWATDFGGIREKTEEIFEAIKKALTSFSNFFQFHFGQFLETIKEYWSIVWNTIETLFSDILTIIVDIFNVFADIFSGDWGKLWEDMRTLVFDIWQAIFDFIGGILDAVITLILGLAVDLFFAAQTAFNEFSRGVKEVWNAFIEWFKLVITDPIAAIKQLDDAINEAGRGFAQSLWDGIQSVWNDFVAWFEEKLQWLQEKIFFWQNQAKSVAGESSLGDHFGLTGGGTGLSYTGKTDASTRSDSKASGTVSTMKTGSTDKSQTSVTNNYNFYSPEPLTPVKAAAEFKRVTQEIALGKG